MNWTGLSFTGLWLSEKCNGQLHVKVLLQVKKIEISEHWEVCTLDSNSKSADQEGHWHNHSCNDFENINNLS